MCRSTKSQLGVFPHFRQERSYAELIVPHWLQVYFSLTFPTHSSGSRSLACSRSSQRSSRWGRAVWKSLRSLQGKDSHSLQEASPFPFAQGEKMQLEQGPNLLSEPQPRHRTSSSGIPNLREIRLSLSGSSFVAI